MSNIFTEGEIVKTLNIPPEIMNGSEIEKKAWGETMLREYLSQLIGWERARYVVAPSRSHNGSITGTKATLRGEKDTTFMLIEPKKNTGRNVVHIARVEEDCNIESIISAIDWQYGEAGRAAKAPLNTPFAGLAGLKINSA